VQYKFQMDVFKLLPEILFFLLPSLGLCAFLLMGLFFLQCFSLKYWQNTTLQFYIPCSMLHTILQIKDNNKLLRGGREHKH